jgi:hypothetical protein
MAEAPTLFYTNIYESLVGKIAIVTMDNGEDYKKPSTLGEKAMACSVASTIYMPRAPT